MTTATKTPDPQPAAEPDVQSVATQEPRAAQAFSLSDFAGVLAVLRVVRLYEARETRRLAHGELVKLGLADGDPAFSPGGRFYTPSAAEQMLADFAAQP